jgi:hypothetical protein
VSVCVVLCSQKKNITRRPRHVATIQLLQIISLDRFASATHFTILSAFVLSYDDSTTTKQVLPT